MAKVMFIDESGDHSLGRIDPQYPMFVLCGVIIDEKHHDDRVTQLLNEFKQSLLGSSKIILHTVDFTRNRAGFERMAEPEFRQRFFSGLERIVEAVEFKLVACAIKKQEHLDRYGLRALDPYMLALSILVERFVFECGSSGGVIVAESRDETLNNALEIAFLDLKVRGTEYVSSKKIRARVHNFAIRDKRENIAGMQLADLAATPIGRHVLGKKTYPTHSKGGDFFVVLEPKFRRDWKGTYEGMGLVRLPK